MSLSTPVEDSPCFAWQQGVLGVEVQLDVKLDVLPTNIEIAALARLSALT